MSVPGSSSLGRRVLELTTDGSKLRQGLSEARALTIQQTARMKADARIQLTADLLRLKADFRQADRDATLAKRQIETQTRYKASMDLSQFRSDLRLQEREIAASARRNQALANYYMRPVAAPSASAGRGGGGLAGIAGMAGGLGQAAAIGGPAAVAAVAAVAAIASAKKLAESLASLAGEALKYGAALQVTESRIVGFTGSTKALGEAQAIANKEAARGRGVYSETLSALADLTPLARTYNTNLEDLLRTTQLLAAADPAQGFEGAATAIREALSGDFTSLVRRFEIPRSEIQKLKDQGVPNLAIVQQALARLGINDTLLDQQANNVSQRIRILKDDLLRTIAGALTPLQKLGSDAIAGIAKALNSPEVQRAAKQFAADIAPLADDLRRIATDPETQRALRTLALDTLALASNLHEVAVAADVALKAIGPFLSTVAKGASVMEQNVAKGAAVVGQLNEQFALGEVVTKAWVSSVVPGAGAVLALTDAVGGLGGALDALGQKLGGKAGALEGFLRLPPGTLTALVETKGGTIVSGPGQRVTAAPQRDFLPDEGREQDATARALRGERAAAQSQAALRGYLDGLKSPAALALFDEAEKFLSGRVDDLFSGLSKEGQQQRQSEAVVLAARVASDIQRSGKVTEETIAAIASTFGDATPAIAAYLTQLAGLSAAQERASKSAGVLEDAQAHLNRVTANGNGDIQAATARLEAAKRIAEEHTQAVRDNIDELQRQQSALSSQAAEAARLSQAKIDQLQAERDEVARLTQAHQDEAQAQIDGLREVQVARSQDAAVKSLEVKQRADLLALEERIRAARSKRTPEGEREARALEDQRNLVQARGNYALDLARQRAAVANDQADSAKRPIEEAAKVQAEKDKAAAEAADGRIRAAQAEAKTVADDFAARDRAIQGQIDAETERGRVLALADRQAITDAQSRLTIVQAIASAQRAAAEFGVTMAQRAKNLSDGELQAQRDLIGVLNEKNTKFGEFVKGWRDLFADMQAVGVNPAVLNAYFGVGTTINPSPFVPSPSRPDVDPPLPASSGAGIGDAARNAFAPKAPRYTPPSAPSNSESYLRMAGATAGANVSNRRSVSLSFPNMVVRETADIDGIIDRAAVKAAELSARSDLAAMQTDDDGGGAYSNWRG